MTKFGFTPPKINALACENGKSQSIYWDTKTPNLGLRITPAGTKSFVFETWFNGKCLRITIGDIKSWSLNKAQAEARRLRVLIDTGIDPREEKAEIKSKAQARRLKGVKGLVVWEEYILERQHQWGDRHKADHIDMARKGGEKITRGLRKGMASTKQVGILFDLLSLPINEITKSAVLVWLKKESPKRPTRTRLALSLLKAFITWMGDHTNYRELVDTSACDRLTRELPPRKAKDDCLQKEQLQTWFNGVKKINNPIICSYLQILLLTGARRNELATLKWKDVDLQWNTIVLRDKVEGNRKIPITPYVASLINMLPRVNEFVFSSVTAKSGRLTEPRKAHNAVIEEVGLPDLSIHGLRRSFGTLSEWVECPVGIVAQLQGHKPSAIAEKHYLKRGIDLLRKWHNKIEKFILDEAGIVQPKTSSKRLSLV
jgi:integrase